MYESAKRVATDDSARDRHIAWGHVPLGQLNGDMLEITAMERHKTCQRRRTTVRVRTDLSWLPAANCKLQNENSFSFYLAQQKGELCVKNRRELSC